MAVLLGIELVEAGGGKCTMKLEAGEQHSNPMGTIHGGIICDLADAAMGMSFFSTLDEGESFTTLELK
ncbi:MAG TPA: PaaI family thioesterase, partial [Gaiellaceae bacterium]|nr:PaaI family thioesterase [Gaiellaceae bacterium]